MKAIPEMRGSAGQGGGLPERDVVFQRHVTRSPLNIGCGPTGARWSLSGKAGTLAATQTKVVSANGGTFYLACIASETHRLAGNTPLPVTSQKS